MRTLTLRALNRATLHRQWLNERHTASALDAIEHLVGMQAQSPLAPYVGLWTRLTDFAPTELSHLLESRQAVRGSMMRATIHMTSSRDFLALRALVQPRLEREVYQNQAYGRHLTGVDMDAVLDAGLTRLKESPATGAQLREHLGPLFPDRDPASLAHAVRCLLPTIQIPPRGIWGKGGNPTLTTADLWLDSPIDPHPSIDALVLRYLAAYGPASPADAQTWSGLTHLTEVFDRLDLRKYVAPNGRTLYDLPTISLPEEDLPVPVRFLPEYDNVLLSHADRTRFIADSTREHLTLTEVLTRGAVLYDGRVVAMWKQVRRPKGAARLEVEPIAKLTKSVVQSIEEEASKLLDFSAKDAVQEIEFIA
ncbi:winged helix DNA-binding domain-containing protein [Kribbella sp. CA-253562]|uniref:winged helix DNA-binding domain-containing protein n=1 Tax=Kribbella sp. CA-253562 TaxID=3239942 RepID=UPI003D930669